MNHRMIIFVALVSMLLCHHRPAPVSGCAAAPPFGHGVAIRDEFALIVWDPETKLEHFIRVANFETTAPDIGFLVPTPSVPTLTEVDAAGISRVLKGQTEAQVITKINEVTRFGLGAWPWRPPMSTATPDGAINSVEVLGQYSVAGYEATVLRAEDPAVLREWLDEREYETSDKLQDWLQIYTEQQWIITAFKLSKPEEAPRMSSKGVRMSFQSERPFYPYREPASDGDPPKTGSRLLRVFLLADQRYEGRIGSDLPWQARTVWSDDMDDHLLTSLAEYASVEATSIPNRLTEFEDRTFPRQGVDELYFHKATSQATVKRPTRTHVVTRENFVPGWRGVLLVGTMAMPLMIVVMGVGFWIFRRNRAQAGQDGKEK